MPTTIQNLRDEGVCEVGAVAGTSVVFVLTEGGAHLFHAAELPPRQLDAYGARFAVARIEMGTASRQVAMDLGVTEEELRRAIRALGYARLGSGDGRRGRLVLVDRVSG